MFTHPFVFLKLILLLMSGIFFTGCVSHPPSDVNNICTIFKQYPKWYRDAKDVEKRWKIPVSVQMAIIHQESKFDARARPSRTRLLGIIPWKRPSSAYGYAQALRATWAQYKIRNGSLFSSRDSFGDGVDFIGWYANEAYKRAKINRTDTYSLYLAYHEGIGGYLNRSYKTKPWLVTVAHKVKARSQTYALQLNSCERSMAPRSWF